MNKVTKIAALILTLCICFASLCTTGFDEEENAVDKTIYNDNSRLFCYVMEILLSKSYSQIISDAEELKPLWMLTREIVISGEYNEEYKETGEGLEAFSSDGYAIKNIKTALRSEYTKRISELYAGIFSSELTKAEILSKCLVIENYMVLYSDLVAITDEVSAIDDFCNSTIEKIKKDSESYNSIINDNLSAFEALADELKNASRAKVIENYPELQRLYLASNLAADADDEALALYKEITFKYLVCAAANQCTVDLVAFLGGKISSEKLYSLLCGISYFTEYADLGESEVSAARTTYLQKLNQYNKKYVEHNDDIVSINRFAGSAGNVIIDSSNENS